MEQPDKNKQESKTPPGWCNSQDLVRIAELSRLVPTDGIIVEVGSLLGQSTYAWAKNCHPSVTIFAIDPWDSTFLPDQMVRDFGTPLSKQVFRENTRDCTNIIPLRGYSPQDVSDWNLPIDVYFDDGLHHNPVFEMNQQFWTPHLKPGGILCGHDFVPEYPDIVNSVQARGKIWGQDPMVSSMVWSLQKPPTFEAARFPESSTRHTRLDGTSKIDYLSYCVNQPSQTIAIVHDPRLPLPDDIRQTLISTNCNNYALIPPQILCDNLAGDLYGILASAPSEPYLIPPELDVLVIADELAPEARRGLQKYLWPRLALTHGIIYFSSPAPADLIAHEMVCLWAKLEAATLSGAIAFRVERAIPKLVCQVDIEHDLTIIQKQAITSRFMDRLSSVKNIKVA